MNVGVYFDIWLHLSSPLGGEAGRDERGNTHIGNVLGAEVRHVAHRGVCHGLGHRDLWSRNTCD